MTYADEHVLVLGLGRSGAAAAKLLLSLGAKVSIYDRDPSRDADLPPGATLLAGDAPPAFEGFDRVVASPGFPLEPHSRLLPEVDLAAERLRAQLIGVTGTNGKGTVTVLIGEMLRESGLRVTIGGNLGTPLCALVDEPADRVVAELSSFQLEHARSLRADVAVLLNLAADHLDRHGTLERYGEAKARLAELQQPGDALVVNLDDPWARSIGERSRARVLGFSTQRTVSAGAFVDGAELVVSPEPAELARIPLAALSRASRTPLSNALPAALAAAAAGASGAAIAAVLARFEGLPHRGESVCVRNGVRYVDDSKATNPAAAAASLTIQAAPVIWIAGGRNKGLDFATLLPAARGVRVALLVGEAAPELARALGGAVEAVEAGTLEKAVAEAAQRAVPGDVVLLAPACASLDQFASSEERGQRFASLARALPGTRAEDSRC